MFDPENYVLVRSLSRISEADIINYFRGTEDGKNIIEENTLVVSPTEILVCFQSPEETENIVKKPVHKLHSENGIVLLFQVDKSFDRSLLSKQRDPKTEFEIISPSKSEASILVKKRDDINQSRNRSRNSRQRGRLNKQTIQRSESEEKETYNHYNRTFRRKENKSAHQPFEGKPDRHIINENSNFDEDDICLEVSGINPKTDDDTIKLFFENVRRSSGGPVKSLKRKEKTIVLLTFSRTIAYKVLGHENLILEDSKLFVRRVCAEDCKVPEPDFDMTKFLVSNISTNISLRSVYDFVEDITGRKQGYKLIKGSILGVRLASFDKNIDYYNIKEKCQKSYGKEIDMHIDRIRITSQIEVHGFSENISKDKLMLYFENEQNGGGEITSINMSNDYDVAIINFKDSTIVKKITKRVKHSINGIQLKINAYYECIGYQQPLEKLPDCICEIVVDHRILNYIKNHKIYSETFNRLIKENNCELETSIDEDKIMLRKQRFSNISTTTWKKTTNDIIRNFLNDFKFSCKENIDDLFNVTKKLFAMVTDSESNININEDLKTVEVVGHKDNVNRIEQKVSELSIIEIVEELSLPAFQMRLLAKSISDYKSNNVKINLHRDDKRVVLKGFRMYVLDTLEKIQKHLFSIISMEISLPPHYCALLKNQSVLQFVINNFKKEFIFASFDVLQNDNIIIGSFKPEWLTKSQNIIKQSIKQVDIVLKEEFLQGNCNENLKNLIKNISEAHTGCIHILIKKDSVVVTAVSGLIDTVTNQIQQFLESNYTSEAVFDLLSYKSVGKFIAQSYQQEVVELSKKFNIHIKISGTSKIFLKGVVQNIDYAKNELNKYILKIISDNYIIAKPEINIWFKDNHIKDCISAIQQKNICLIEELIEPKASPPKTLSYQDKTSQSTPLAQSVSSIPTSNKLQSAISYAKVDVQQGDITKVKVDAIVNGIYQNSIKSGAISTAIIKAAGSSVENEFSSTTPVQTGFTITSGGNLSMCSHIIHMQLNFSNMENDLIECFKISEKRGFKSIALPAFGTGNAGQNASLMASHMFEAVKKFNQLQGNQHLKDIIIVIFDANLMQEFSDELSEHNVFLKSSILCNDVDTFSINGLIVQLKTGDIFNENVDIIVNSIERSLNLSNAKGAVAKHLRDKGGPQIVDECKKIGGTNAEGLAFTNAGKLPFKHIIHFATDDSNNLWEQRVSDCLVLADSLGVSSIAMPVFGTGVGGLSTAAAANILLSGLLKFPKATNLKTVKIIIFVTTMLPEFITIFQTSLKSGISSGLLNSSTSIGITKIPSPAVPDYPPKKFVLYVKDQPTLVKVKKDLDTWFDDKIDTEEILFNSDISQNILEIVDIGNKEKVIIIFDSNDKKVIVKGLSQNVSKAIVKLHEFNFSINKALLLSQTVQWYVRDTINSNYQPVTQMMNVNLENAFHLNLKTLFTINSGQYNITSSLLKRKNIADDKTPVDWEDMKGNEAIVVIDPNSAEYKMVANHFTSSIQRNVSILKISRIQNKSLHDQYRAQKEMMNKKNLKANNERILYHGTDSSCLASINSTGFNRSLAGQNGTAYGNGSYFALNASYSDGYARPNSISEKNMYHCKVLTGIFTVGNSGMKIVPPPNDSLVDNTSRPSIFVIFHDAAAYPEYLITYK